MNSTDNNYAIPKQAYIDHQQLLMLYHNIPTSMMISLLNAVVVSVVLWPVVEQQLLMSWLAVLLVMVLFRSSAYLSFIRLPATEHNAPKWRYFQCTGVVISGILWGCLSLLFFHQGGVEQQMVIAFVVAGMCAGAVTTLSYSQVTVFAFITPVLASLFFSLLGRSSVASYAMALMTIVFWLGMLVSARRWYQNAYVSMSEHYDSMQRERMLEDNQVRIQTLVDTALDGIITSDINGTIKVFNPAAERMFGYTQRETLGANISILMPDNYAFLHADYMKNYLHGKSAKLLGIPRDLQGRRKNGEVFPLEVNLTEMHIQGQVMFSAIVRDVTQRRALEDELRMATHMAQEANRAKSEFLSGLSHEIRTPMNAIIGFADLLQHDDRLLEEQQDYVAEIKRAGGHLVELMSDVLDLSKVEAGKINLEMGLIDVAQPLSDALSLVHHMALARQIDIHADLPAAGQVLVYADATRLKQVMLNLLSNATKYNREGGEIVVRCLQQSGDELIISVRDTGRGISQEQQAKLFKPFERLDAEGSQIEGTGLGLMLSKHFVEIMGGKLTLSSEPGVGSEFFVTLRSCREADIPSNDLKQVS